MAGVTTYDCLMRSLAKPEQQQAFFSNPNSLHDPYHLTPTDAHEVYDAVDPLKNPKLSQEGKVVFITGANRGIGRGIAIAFAKAKAKAVVLTARDLGKLQEVEKEIIDSYPNTKVLVIKMDVTSESEVKAAFATAIEAFGAVNIAIHNAGSNNDFVPITQSDMSSWWSQYEVHVKGLYLVAKEFLLGLGQNPGTIINVSSTAAISAFPTQTGYSGSKLAANRIIEVLHYDHPNARVFNMHPGIVDTELTKSHHVQQMGFIMDSPELAGGMSLFLTTPDAEFLRGRWVSANWNVDELVEMRDLIVKEHLLVSGLNGKLGKE